MKIAEDDGEIRRSEILIKHVIDTIKHPKFEKKRECRMKYMNTSINSAVKVEKNI